jgi:hypothetical protein
MHGQIWKIRSTKSQHRLTSKLGHKIIYFKSQVYLRPLCVYIIVWKATKIRIHWRPRRSAAPLWNEIRFCERTTATSRAFYSVIIKADLSDRYEGAWLLIENELSRYVTMNSELENFAMQTFSNEITFSVNKSRSSGLFIYHFVVHSWLSWYAIVEHVS